MIVFYRTKYIVLWTLYPLLDPRNMQNKKNMSLRSFLDGYFYWLVPYADSTIFCWSLGFQNITHPVIIFSRRKFLSQQVAISEVKKHIQFVLLYKIQFDIYFNLLSNLQHVKLKTLLLISYRPIKLRSCSFSTASHNHIDFEINVNWYKYLWAHWFLKTFSAVDIFPM